MKGFSFFDAESKTQGFKPDGSDAILPSEGRRKGEDDPLCPPCPPSASAPRPAGEEEVGVKLVLALGKGRGESAFWIPPPLLDG